MTSPLQVDALEKAQAEIESWRILANLANERRDAAEAAVLALQQQLQLKQDEITRLTVELSQREVPQETRDREAYIRRIEGQLDALYGAKFSDRVYHALKSRAEAAEVAVLALTAQLEQRWQPIETAPKDDVCWFWVRPKTSEEAYLDTSMKSIFSAGPERAWIGKYKCWSSLETADYWMPYQPPLPPPKFPGGARHE